MEHVPRSPQPRPPLRTRRRRWLVGIVIALAVCIGGGIAAASVLGDLQEEVADGTRLTMGETDSTVIVPEGWLVRGAGHDVLTVRTPDGVLTARVAVAEGDDSTALDRVAGGLRAEPGADPGAPRHEVLASGADVVHADIGTRGLAAVVGTSSVVTLAATVEEPARMADYRRAVAELLEGIRP